MDEQEYLEPGFDPASLTIPRLRSILVAHDVHYPASAKKSQLIEIFNDKVASQARKLRAANARVKRTSRGIENVSPVKDEESEDEVADLHRLRQTRTPARTPRRTTRARTEEVEELPPPSRNTRHSTAPPESTPRQPTIKHAHTLEELSEPEPKRPASRKTRPSVATPALKQEHEEDDSPFSNDNVFQTGSSPLAPPSTGRRRTTLGVRDSSRSRTRENRRKTDDLRQFAPQNDGAIVPTRRTFDIPLQKIKQEEDIEPTEEFTPEEQQALVAHQQSGAVVPARQKRKSASSSVAKTGIGSILTVLLATAGYLWSEEKFKVGYCGVGQPSTEIRGVEIPEWADSVRPPCEPCPPHAYCHDNLKTVCEQGFILTPHPLSLGGLLPLPPTCEADSARARRVKAVKDRAVEELREQNAKYECGEAVQPELKETELKRAIATYRRKDMSNDEFEDLWASALGELQAVEEITSGSDGLASVTQSFDRHHSQESPSLVPSEDPFSKRLEDMFGHL